MRGMMGRMMGGMAAAWPARRQQAELKKQSKTLTRTDFLIQFVWKPLKPEERPKTDEERDEKLKEIVDKTDRGREEQSAVKVSPARCRRSSTRSRARSPSRSSPRSVRSARAAGDPVPPAHRASVRRGRAPARRRRTGGAGPAAK